ncbi:MAG: hypothetical protein ACUVWO_13560 [Thermodesulfobacteriota bacterium]
MASDLKRGPRRERETDMERKEEQERQLVRLGMIYNVKRQRFNIVYKDLVTSEIRIVSSDDRENDEAPMSISAA